MQHPRMIDPPFDYFAYSTPTGKDYQRIQYSDFTHPVGDNPVDLTDCTSPDQRYLMAASARRGSLRHLSTHKTHSLERSTFHPNDSKSIEDDNLSTNSDWISSIQSRQYNKPAISLTKRPLSEPSSAFEQHPMTCLQSLHLPVLLNQAGSDHVAYRSSSPLLTSPPQQALTSPFMTCSSNSVGGPTSTPVGSRAGECFTRRSSSGSNSTGSSSVPIGISMPTVSSPSVLDSGVVQPYITPTSSPSAEVNPATMNVPTVSSPKHSFLLDSLTQLSKLVSNALEEEGSSTGQVGYIQGHDEREEERNCPSDGEDESSDDYDELNASTESQRRLNREEIKIQPYATRDSIEIFRCPLCSKDNIFDRSRLTLHLQEHQSNVKRDDCKHICCFCSSELSSNSSLERHLLTHTNHRPFNCSHCGKAFTTNGNLSRHMRTSHHLKADYSRMSVIVDQNASDLKDSIINETTHQPSTRFEPGPVDDASSTIDRHSEPTNNVNSTSACNQPFEFAADKSTLMATSMVNTANNSQLVTLVPLLLSSISQQSTPITTPVVGRSLADKTTNQHSLYSAASLPTSQNPIDAFWHHLSFLANLFHLYQTSNVSNLVGQSAVNQQKPDVTAFEVDTTPMQVTEMANDRRGETKRAITDGEQAMIERETAPIRSMSSHATPLPPIKRACRGKLKEECAETFTVKEDVLNSITGVNSVSSHVLDLSLPKPNCNMKEDQPLTSLVRGPQQQSARVVNTKSQIPIDNSNTTNQQTNINPLPTTSLVNWTDSVLQVPLIKTRVNIGRQTATSRTTQSMNVIDTSTQSVGATQPPPPPYKKNSYKDAPKLIRCPIPGCTQKFPWNSSLKRHILTHTPHKPFACTRCSKSFSTKSNRERHMERVHQISLKRQRHRVNGDDPADIGSTDSIVSNGSRFGPSPPFTSNMVMQELREDEILSMTSNEQQAEDISNSLLSRAGDPVVEPNPERLLNPTCFISSFRQRSGTYRKTKSTQVKQKNLDMTEKVEHTPYTQAPKDAPSPIMPDQSNITSRFCYPCKQYFSDSRSAIRHWELCHSKS